MRGANFVLKKIALEAFISYEQMCNNKVRKIIITQAIVIKLMAP